MITKKLITTLLFLCPAMGTVTYAQDKLYPQLFPLSDVELLDGPFKHAQDLNRDVLLRYDVDRLLAPFLIEAGITPKGEKFANWPGLDGHVAGHYLSAMAMNYKAGGGEEFKRRMDYMLSELRKCQEANGDGYIGGIPGGKEGWTEIRNGNVGAIWKYWAPWYNLHKLYAGLRDAWLYADSELAKKMFLEYCDWGISVINGLNDGQMEQMLDNEFGGMNEVFADAYQMSGDTKYLDAAKRFSHRWLFDSMRDGVDNLDNKHANTQVPKAVGYQRVAELSGKAGRGIDAEDYTNAAGFFWQTVTGNRSLAFGGNSRREHFPDDTDYLSYVDDREGPESCNTYNMLRLTEGLFRMNPESAYADFYERALFNHILSTQHPGHGGYVYFTPARPAHYRVYSAPNEAMWCCVGTGMENHGKYGEFIYAHSGDSLYVNLFIPSRLEWKKQNISVTQTTSFPDQGSTRLTVNTKNGSKFPLFLRKPGWVDAEKVTITVNGKPVKASVGDNGYYDIDRKWENGDVVEIIMPMDIRIEELKHHPEYIAIMRGPILLGANVGDENLDGLVADDHRWGHIAHGPLISVFNTPIIIGDREEIVGKLRQMEPVSGKACTFTVPDLFEDKYSGLELQPFATLHDCRYMIYWLSMSDDQYNSYQAERKETEMQRLQLDAMTVDMVTCGEQQPEIDHKVESDRSATGNTHGAAWRKADNNGYFTYELSTNGKTDLSLYVTYWGNEKGNSQFEILVGDEQIATENLQNKWNADKFMTMEYPIPDRLLEDKDEVKVTFKPKEGAMAGPVFNLRLLAPQGGQEGVTLSSPGNKVAVAINAPSMSSMLFGEVKMGIVGNPSSGETDILSDIKLGVKTDRQNFSDNMRLVGVSDMKTITDDYIMITGKKSHCLNKGNERTYTFENNLGQIMNVTCRAYDDGVAFRYSLPDVDGSGENLTEEFTTYPISDGKKRWIQHYEPSSYEDFYPLMTDGGKDMDPKKSRHWAYPVLIESADSIFALITEANLMHGHSASYLDNSSNPEHYIVRQGTSPLPIKSGYTSPWRVVIAGNLADIVESTLVTDVSEPQKISDTSWIQPAAASWIYWAYNHGSKDYQIVRKYVDLGAEMNWPYVLIDWEWAEMENGGDIHDALAYAHDKGLKPLLWYNSSTNWIGEGAPTPLFRLNKPKDRKQEMEWLRDNGVAGIKIDFFKGDDVNTIDYYLDILEDAAKYGILITFHGATLPRGWQRTYPHMMTVEGVYGAEWYNNGPMLTQKAAAHNCTLPFTRNVVGPMDYTPGTFSDSQHRHVTSHGHELALPILFESAIQHMPDRPESYYSLPEEVKKLLSSLPTAWDETRLLNGYPADHVVMARRKGGKWYVAGINGLDSPRRLSLEISKLGLKGREMRLFMDGTDQHSFTISNIIDAKDMEIDCLPYGGFVAVVE